jgi:hypothetical protein
MCQNVRGKISRLFEGKIPCSSHEQFNNVIGIWSNDISTDSDGFKFTYLRKITVKLDGVEHAY